MTEKVQTVDFQAMQIAKLVDKLFDVVGADPLARKVEIERSVIPVLQQDKKTTINIDRFTLEISPTTSPDEKEKKADDRLREVLGTNESSVILTYGLCPPEVIQKVLQDAIDKAQVLPVSHAQKLKLSKHTGSFVDTALKDETGLGSGPFVG